MSDRNTRQIIEQIADTLDIPESAYEKAELRYKDLGEWFGRPESTCAGNKPHIYSQGSFRLGTVIRPLVEGEEYDLDVGCRLCDGITKETHTQKELKGLVGKDIENYRKARGIESAIEEMHRCWRLRYKDELSFHMDVVPSIPEQARQRQMIKEAMIRHGISDSLAGAFASHAGSITDDRHPGYAFITPDWRISNSEGYARWFESRMKLAKSLMEKRAFAANAAQVEDLPTRKWKSPLQRCVQILKRHRDVMFADEPDGKPISVIITTLAAAAYQGEQDMESALDRILADMGQHVRPTSPRVPNPVNPVEDFADKWSELKSRHLNLEDNFWTWLSQAQADFRILAQSRDPKVIVEQARTKFASALDGDSLRRALGLSSVNIVTEPKSHRIAEAPAKPWSCA